MTSVAKRGFCCEDGRERFRLSPMNAITLPGVVVDTTWLAAHLHQDGLVVLCASMGNPVKSQTGIPGAFLADIEADFSSDSPTPHTVPDNLTSLLESYEISDDTAVVVYDRFGMTVAPRVWWLLRVAGLRNVAVLDGGLPAWIAAGNPTQSLTVPIARGKITAQPHPELLIDIEQTAQALDDAGRVVIDARSAGRFQGEEAEPRAGLNSGHMPGSRNIPFPEIAPGGFFLPAEQIRERIQLEAGDTRDLVFSCGSGVTACVTALGAILAGYEDVVVYDGSWSEWGNPASGKPVATGPAN